MKKGIIIVLALAVLAAGCATIISGTKQNVTVTSEPSGAQVDVKTTGGVPMFTGATPAYFQLKRSYEYQITVKMEGYRDQELFINHDFNAWVVGNLICGGLLGLIVDAVDGAMWNLSPDMIHVELVRSVSSGRISYYAVVGAIDDQGRLRTIALPMIPVN